jgi:hypothetical protein
MIAQNEQADSPALCIATVTVGGYPVTAHAKSTFYRSQLFRKYVLNSSRSLDKHYDLEVPTFVTFHGRQQEEELSPTACRQS